MSGFSGKDLWYRLILAIPNMLHELVELTSTQVRSETRHYSVRRELANLLSHLRPSAQIETRRAHVQVVTAWAVPATAYSAARLVLHDVCNFCSWPPSDVCSRHHY